MTLPLSSKGYVTTGQGSCKPDPLPNHDQRKSMSECMLAEKLHMVVPREMFHHAEVG